MSENKNDRRDMSLTQKLSRAETGAPPWSIASALTSLGVMMVGLIVLGPALASLLLGSQEATPTLLMMGWAIGPAATTAYVVVSRRSSSASWLAMRLRAGHLPLPMGLLIGVAIALAIDLIIGLVSGRFLPVPEIFGFHTQGISSLIAAAVLIVLLQPVAETLVFQAVILPSLRWRLGPWRGVFATCLLYVLLHTLVYFAPYQAAYDAVWHGLAYPLLLCLTFTLLKIYTDSSLTVLLARICAGAIFLLTALALTGM